MTHYRVQGNELFVMICIELKVVKFEGIWWCLRGGGVWVRNEENVDCERAPKCDCVPVGVSVCPNSSNTLHYRVVL
jgi:hypothetical protein